MKLDLLSYLELVVQHKDATLAEYPSRFCIIRVPFERINFSKFCSIELSLGQLRKIHSIGLTYSCDWHDYIVIGHRPFDNKFIGMYPEFNDKFFDSLSSCYHLFWPYFDDV